MRAWHFVGEALRDGRPVPADGVKLVHVGPLKMCESGLHASERLLDALSYAPGNTICRVEVGGKITQDADKLVASERTILWRIDGTQILREFARRCALDVIHLWDPPEIVRQYLETGDESISAAAGDAARAARDAAGDAARAARDAAGDAARAAGDAAGDAAMAARDAAWAARAAAMAAGDAAMAAREAAWAARAAAGDAARAARDAARAARDAQDIRLTEMVLKTAGKGDD